MKHLLILFFFVLTPTFVLAQTESVLPQQNPTLNLTQSEVLPDPLKIFNDLMDQEELLLAKENIKELIGATTDEVAKQSYLEKLYALNMKILFSKIETANSVTYEVVSGDTLGKIAKSHNTTIDLIKKSNGLESDLIRPMQKFKIFQGKFSVHVDKSDNILKLIADGEVLREYRVATGEKNSTPIGTFKIKTKVEDPTWYTEGAIVPPDSPENILGSRWMGFDKEGYGIHGTTLPESIGTQSTSGCVRMFNEEVEELFSILPYGTEVEVID